MSLLALLQPPFTVNSPARMSPRELRASLSLASIFGLRLFGMFVILPVFALWAEGGPAGPSTLVGIALGAYGLTQALLQIPFGVALRPPRPQARALLRASRSSPPAASPAPLAESPWTVIAGRVLQGAGAISGVAIAMAADLTRESAAHQGDGDHRLDHRRGLRASRFVSAPFLQHSIGVPGIFALTGVLAIARDGGGAMGRARTRPRARPGRGAISRRCCASPELVRLNVGIFALHAVLMAMFVVVPVALVTRGLPARGALAGSTWARWSPGFVLDAARPSSGCAPRTSGACSSRRSRRDGRRSRVLAAGPRQPRGDRRRRSSSSSPASTFLKPSSPRWCRARLPREATGAATGVYSSVQFLGRSSAPPRAGPRAARGLRRVLLACLPRRVAAWLAVGLEHGRFRAGRIAGVAHLEKGGSSWHRSTRSSSSATSGAIPKRATCPTAARSRNISVATTDKWKDKSGEMQEKTEWHRVAFFGKLAEIAGEYLKKGSQVYVEGRLQTRKWQDKDGADKYTDGDRRQPHADAGLAPGHGRRRADSGPRRAPTASGGAQRVASARASKPAAKPRRQVR